MNETAKETAKNFFSTTYLIPGSLVAGVLSFAVNKSVIWAILHMLCGWVYVTYWICSYSNIIEKYIWPLIAQ